MFILLFLIFAAQKVTELLVSKSSHVGLRVGIRGGGCSGFTYFLEFAESANKGDKELDSRGVTLFVDPKSYLYLWGLKLTI